MTTTEHTIIRALNTTLATVTGLHPVDYPGPRMNTPCVVPLLSWEHDARWGKVSQGPVEVRLLILVKWGATGNDGARLLSEYCSAEGDLSVPAALMATHTADGALSSNVVQSLRIVEVEEPKQYSFPDGQVYWGRTIRLVLTPKESS